MKRMMFWIVFGLLIVSISSCGLTARQMMVRRPAEMDLHSPKTIAVGEIYGRQGSHNEAYSDALESMLVGSGEFSAVVDRDKLSLILEEQKLSLSGLTEEALSAKAGSLAGVAYYVFGRLNEGPLQFKLITNLVPVTSISNYDEVRFVPEGRDRRRPVTNRVVTTNSFTNLQIIQNVKYSISVILKVIAVESGEIVGMKEYQRNYEDSTVIENAERPRVLAEKWFDRFKRESVDLFRFAVAPYSERVEVMLQTEDKIPDMARGIKAYQAGQTADAIDIFLSITGKVGYQPQQMAKVYYNLAMVETYSGEFESAAQHLKTAIELNPNEGLYKNAQKILEQERIYSSRLKRQE